MPNPRVVLKPGAREALSTTATPGFSRGRSRGFEGMAADGDVIDVTDARGGFLARGLLNRRSQIVVRLFTWQEGEDLTPDLLYERIAAAQARRAGVLPRDTTPTASSSASPTGCPAWS